MRFELEVNGTKHAVDVDPGTPLLWVLRDELGLVGTKYSCGVAQCGACTAHLDGTPVRTCVTPIKAVRKRKVTTIEGVAGPVADAVRGAWEGLQVPQCGYCQAGQIRTTIALLSQVPRPGDEDIDLALDANICRCATYTRIRGAVHDAASKLGGAS